MGRGVVAGVGAWSSRVWAGVAGCGAGVVAGCGVGFVAECGGVVCSRVWGGREQRWGRGVL